LRGRSTGGVVQRRRAPLGHVVGRDAASVGELLAPQVEPAREARTLAPEHPVADDRARGVARVVQALLQQRNRAVERLGEVAHAVFVRCEPREHRSERRRGLGAWCRGDGEGRALSEQLRELRARRIRALDTVRAQSVDRDDEHVRALGRSLASAGSEREEEHEP
jgi:hypothetical protein